MNNTNGDGCSSNCLVENGYYWVGGSATSSDICGNNTIYTYFDSIDLENTVYISFSQPIYNQSITKNDLSIEITGPANSYFFNFSISFITSKILQIDLYDSDIIFGYKNEVMKIVLNKSKFHSTNGGSLYNNTIIWNPYQIVGMINKFSNFLKLI